MAKAKRAKNSAFSPKKAKQQDQSKTSIFDTLGDDTARKMKMFVENSIKRKIMDAQKDPKVVEASKKFASNN